VLEVTTANDVLIKATSGGDRVAMLWQDPSGAWLPIASKELYGRVRALADQLLHWGIERGDRVALLSENRWEWAVTDFAVLALGAVDVPLYATLTADQIGYMLRDSGAKALILSSREQFEKLQLAGALPDLSHVVIMDPAPSETAAPAAETTGSFTTHAFSDIMASAASKQAPDTAFDALVARTRPGDPMTIIYTSGTTGEPKGVVLTHGNMASNLRYSTAPLGFTEKDTCISFLPLSHVTARHVDYALMMHGARLAYCPRFDQLPAAMKALQPTIFVAVPRVYEKIRQAVEAKSAASPIKSRILAWALATGRKHRPATLAGTPSTGIAAKLADKLVFSKIREAFGGQVKIFVSGGAPLGMDTAGWFADAGIRIFEGYGLTETSPVIAVNYPAAHRIGTVGKLLPNLECRFADDGELEVRGPSVFAGYWHKEAETAAAFTPDHWFRTGDIGHLDADGFLSITDRKKELLKTSGGKLIAPQPIENKLKAHALVGQAALVGDKHKFASVLISPNFAALEAWAHAHGVANSNRRALVEDPKVIALYQKIVDQVNGTLASFEDIKRLRIVPDEWSIETDELTPSMKLKRRVVEKKYAAFIAAFYHDESTSTR
jgi:long-chain acyl-CoA synthetase